MTSVTSSTPNQGTPVNDAPTQVVNAAGTPVRFSISPSVISPPYQTNTSHAARSRNSSSQLRTLVSNNAAMPDSVTTVTLTFVHAEVIQRRHTTLKTTSGMRSWAERRPSRYSSFLANSGAAGVDLISGGYTRYTM